MSKATVPQIFAQWTSWGAPAKDARKMAAICLRETGGTLDLQSHNYNPPREDSWGIYQINLLAHGANITQECATTFVCSSRFAFNLYKANGWRDWAGTQNDAELESMGFYARVDKDLRDAGMDPNVPVDIGAGAVGGTTDPVDDIKEGVRDFLIILAIELVAFMCIGVGLWGIATGKSNVGQTVSGTVNAAWNTGKKAVTKGIL